VGVAGSDGYDIRTVDIEAYVAGVLTGEAARESPPAVLEALAVAIRTYALKNLNRHSDAGFDVCDETHCQVWRRPSAMTTSAAQATAGQVLTWQGGLATVYYSASCGGHSQVPSAVWPGAEDPPYLPSRPDDGCGGDPVWTASLRTADIERTLRSQGYRGSLVRMRVLSRDRSGRVARLRLDGMRPSVIGGPELRMALGSTKVRSTAFELTAERDAYAFSGHGYGHGVGMCVIGATRLAARGESSRALLARYYPGTVIGTIEVSHTPLAAEPAPAAVPAAAVPSPEKGDRPMPAPVAADTGSPADLQALVRSALTQLARQLGVSARPVAVEVHGTGESYERATARHWFTFGALAHGTIHLMPLDQLRQRGLLERVVRRELVHSLVDGELTQRPQWVRDGAALHYADPQPVDTVGRGPCPSDLDLLQPVSAGALAQAYAQARACFAKQVSHGRGWRDVR
ncbi:MAG: SpoIID/LytB domain-containing protein, partial [Vicinamibacterales bacterium]